MSQQGWIVCLKLMEHLHAGHCCCWRELTAESIGDPFGPTCGQLAAAAKCLGVMCPKGGKHLHEVAASQNGSVSSPSMLASLTGKAKQVLSSQANRMVYAAAMAHC
jgi:hypothetical protein